jgi:hypothetical protein
MRASDALSGGNMAARDILALNTNLAPRLIRCLYIVALVLIAVMVVLGVVRGVRIMTRPPMPPVTMTDNAAPDAAAPQPPQPGMTGQRFGDRRMMMERRFGRRDFGGRRMGMFGMGRNPMLAGIFVIFGALLRGIIILMIVRILAELGLAVLAMPRRSEI